MKRLVHHLMRIKKNRKHIHFVSEIVKHKQISGYKKESNVIIIIDMKKCLEVGKSMEDNFHHYDIDLIITDLIESKPYLLSGFAIGFDHIKCFLRHSCYIRLNNGTGKIEEEEEE